MHLVKCWKKIDDLQLAEEKYHISATAKLFAQLCGVLGHEPRHQQIAREGPQELSRAKFTLNSGTYYVGHYSFWVEDGTTNGKPCFLTNPSFSRADQIRDFQLAVRQQLAK